MSATSEQAAQEFVGTHLLNLGPDRTRSISGLERPLVP